MRGPRAVEVLATTRPAPTLPPRQTGPSVSSEKTPQPQTANGDGKAMPKAPSRMQHGRAKQIAERALRGSLEATGTPLVFHVRRVAKASPIFARSVAWLHEVLENSSVSEEELLTRGLTDDELRALRLLTRDRDS